MIKKYKLQKVIVSVLTILLITACLEEKDVTGPVPYGQKTTDLDLDNLTTLSGNYKPTKVTFSQLPDSPDVIFLDTIINIRYQENDGNLQYNYVAERKGYTNRGDVIKNRDFTDYPINNIKILEDGSISIDLEEPIVIEDSEMKYYIHGLQKQNDLYIDITDNTDSNIFGTPTVCDPTIAGVNDDNSCSSVSGALKYIGYYRIEEITCAGKSYTGGKDFAGEMVTNPGLGNDTGKRPFEILYILDENGKEVLYDDNGKPSPDGKPRQDPLRVSVPINLKVQVLGKDLAECLLTSEQKADNILYLESEDNDFLLNKDDYNGSAGLGGAFTKVGLEGIKDSDNLTRTTEIIYYPKLADKDKDGNFPTRNFGTNNNEVSMRLKILQGNGGLNQLPMKIIDGSPYFKPSIR